MANSDPTDKDFALPDIGIPSPQRAELIKKLRDYLCTQNKKMLGYQFSVNLEYRQELQEFLDYSINNIGDPFEDSHYTVHTRWLERAVLDYYARLWKAKERNKPLAADAYWGYVLSMGSSEGNVYALWNARDYLSGKTLLLEPSGTGAGEHDVRYMYVQDTPPSDNENAYSPVAFYSGDTHYSVAKALRVLNVPNFYEVGTQKYPHANPLAEKKPWPTEVPSERGDAGPGRVDVKKLVTLVEFFARMGHPIIVNLNYGSTFKGAYDDVKKVCDELRPIFKKYGLDNRKVRYGRRNGDELVDKRVGYWIHVDGALGATYAPYLHKAIDKKLITNDGSGNSTPPPRFDFSIPEVASIVTSGHKYPGASWPSGIFMTKRSLQMLPPRQPAVTGSPDTTFGGSRNGFSPLVLWDHLARNPESKQIETVRNAQKIAAYALEKLKELDATLPADRKLHPARSPWGLSVWFRTPTPDVVHRYSLSSVPLLVPPATSKKRYAHLWAMSHVTKKLIDDLVTDIAKTRGADQEEKTLPDGLDKLWSQIEDIVHSADVRQLALVPLAGPAL
jgi:histidine decarboxylase